MASEENHIDKDVFNALQKSVLRNGELVNLFRAGNMRSGAHN